MDSIYVLIIIGAITSFYSGLALFAVSIAILSNHATRTNETMSLKIPAMLQEDDDVNDELSYYNLTAQVRIQPSEAILVTTKNVSAIDYRYPL